MVSQRVKVINNNGIHLRPAGTLAKEAVKFSSLINFKVPNRNYIGNSKSVLSILAGRVKKDDELEFICEGEDEQEALKTIIELIENGIGEEV